jgi:hypothetical protein
MRSASSGDASHRSRPAILRGRLSFGVFALMGLTAFCATLGSQSPQRPSAVMLKRIAEAVDGNRTGADVYVVASYEPTNPVLGVFDNPKAAADEAARAGALAAVFGPYQTELASTGRDVSVCVHDGFRSVMEGARCPKPQKQLRPQDIASMTLVISRTNGERDTIPVPRGADAIFLGLPAIDKFVIPYYLRTLGLAAANDMRRDFERAYSSDANR